MLRVRYCGPDSRIDRALNFVDRPAWDCTIDNRSCTSVRFYREPALGVKARKINLPCHSLRRRPHWAFYPHFQAPILITDTILSLEKPTELLVLLLRVPRRTAGIKMSQQPRPRWLRCRTNQSQQAPCTGWALRKRIVVRCRSDQ